jgi:hypothetical protein
MLSRWHTTGRFVAGESTHPLTVMPWNGGEQRTEHNALHERLGPGSARVTTFAPSICFEAVWPGAFNQLVREGAEFLVNLTDDGWFGDSAGPYQHLQRSDGRQRQRSLGTQADLRLSTRVYVRIFSRSARIIELFNRRPPYSGHRTMGAPTPAVRSTASQAGLWS